MDLPIRFRRFGIALLDHTSRPAQCLVVRGSSVRVWQLTERLHLSHDPLPADDR